MSLQYRLRGHESSVSCLAYSRHPDPYLISGDQAGRIRVWSSSRRRSHLLSPPNSVPILSVVLTDDDTIIGQLRDSTLVLYHLPTSQAIETVVDGPAYYSFCRMALHPSSTCLVGPSGDRGVCIRSVRPARKAAGIQIELDAEQGRPMSLCWTGDDIVAVGSEAGHVLFWDRRNPAHPLHAIALCRTPIFSLAYNPVLGALVTGSSTRQLHTCQYDRSRGDGLLPGPVIHMTDLGVNRLASRSDQRLLAVCTWQSQALIYTWKSRRLVAVLAQHKDKIADVCFAEPSVGLIATAGQDHVISIYKM